MPRRSTLIVALALLVSACAGGADSDGVPSSGATPPSSAASSVASTTEADATTSTQEAAPEGEEATEPIEPTRPDPDPNRPLAPDFELLLSTGETYQLSADTRPVFLVFWAEW